MNKHEAITAIRYLLHLHGCEQEGIESGQPDRIEWLNAVDAAAEAIERIETGASPSWKPEKPFLTFSKVRESLFDKEQRFAFYSGSTFWWTHSEQDLVEATNMGVEAQEKHLQNMLNDPSIPKDKKAEIKAAHIKFRNTEHQIPLDPTGSPLYQMPLNEWIKHAELRPTIYGRHGHDALMASHHQNAKQNGQVLTAMDWETYNKMIDILKGVDHPENMKMVYISHPVEGDVENNMMKICQIIREVNSSEKNVVPMVPYYTDLISLDEDPSKKIRMSRNRLAIIKSGAIQELRLYGSTISEEMKVELDLAMAINIPVEAMTPETQKQLDSIIAYQKQFDEGDSKIIN